MINIDCGLKHVALKTSLGKLFTWGWGQHGQLGHAGSNANELSPKLVGAKEFVLDKIF